MTTRIRMHCVLAGITLAAVSGATAQSRPDTAAGATPPARTVVAGERYAAGWLHRLFLGSQYRRLWATPISVGLLDLDTTAGGLTPLRRGGFGQTRSLHLRGADGVRYVFRSVDKDPSQGLPSELEDTFVDAIVQDQVSANHPYAALVVAPLLDAIGILHVKPFLAVMPDDPRLGEFRAEFAGMLGQFEERPNEAPGDEPGFEGLTKIVQSETLFERLENDPEHRVHARDFLAARLFDLYVGDRDRHIDQWRWARDETGDRRLWRPIPKDRDQAFVMLDGLVMGIIRVYRPQFEGFGRDYGNVVGAMDNGRPLDRRLLNELDWAAWDSVVTALQTGLTDSVIEAAVRRLPPAAFEQNGEVLIGALRRRRDNLRTAARTYYESLATYVDVHATDKDEIAWVDRLPTGDVALRIARDRRRRGPGDPYFHRRFLAAETREIRLYLQGGDDRVIVRGTAPRSIRVRIIGGGGDDVFADSSVVGGGETATHFYDGRDDNTFIVGPGTKVDEFRPDPLPDEERFAPPPPPNAFDPPTQNWGNWWYPNPWITVEPDLGLTFGGGPTIFGYGFRKYPYRWRLDFRVGYATGEGQPRIWAALDLPVLGRRVGAEIELWAPMIGVTRFHGFGNQTTDDLPRDPFFDVDQLQYSLSPGLVIRLARNTGVRVGVEAKLVDTDVDPGSILASVAPVGLGTFGLVGGRLGLRFDSRDVPRAARKGVLLEVEGKVFPPILDVPETFSKLRAEARTYLTATEAPGRPTLALRAAGERVWGDFPFFEGAFLGGIENLRGFRRDRFAGDASLHGSAELRLALTRVSLLLPGAFGVLGFADGGRVFLDGESSDKWHADGGGGVWFAPIGRANTLSLSAATAGDGVRVYFHAGFAF